MKAAFALLVDHEVHNIVRKLAIEVHLASPLLRHRLKADQMPPARLSTRAANSLGEM